MTQQKEEGMLSPYRVLDLTDEKGLLCGKLLGDMGADVIKIERPGGDPARRIGPFYHDEPDPEKSLFWWAFNTSKRGITLDIETADGQDAFRRLVESADFVIESFPPGYMDELGLGYSTLEKLNPGVIMASITPFGQSGPYRDYKAPDIVAWALTGWMHRCGDPDRPPVRVSHHGHVYLHAAAEAAVGALTALYWRHMTGEGQHVDVSVQASLGQGPFMATAMWDAMRIVMPRGETTLHQPGVGVTLRQTWPCKDGLVTWYFFSGMAAMQRNPQLIEFMESEGMADDFLKGFDWSTFDYTTTTQEIVDRLEEPTARFFMAHTKSELLEGAIKYGVTLYPTNTTRDILADDQLGARGYWAQVEHPELGARITYPGPFAHTSEMPPKVSCRAPLIGEHNEEIYEKELGMSKGELLILRQANVI